MAWGLRLHNEAGITNEANCTFATSIVAMLGCKIIMSLGKSDTMLEVYGRTILYLETVKDARVYIEEYFQGRSTAQTRHAAAELHKMESLATAKASSNFSAELKLLQSLCELNFNFFQLSVIMSRLKAKQLGLMQSYLVYCMRDAIYERARNLVKTGKHSVSVEDQTDQEIRNSKKSNPALSSQASTMSKMPSNTEKSQLPNSIINEDFKDRGYSPRKGITSNRSQNVNSNFEDYDDSSNPQRTRSSLNTLNVELFIVAHEKFV